MYSVKFDAGKFSSRVAQNGAYPYLFHQIFLPPLQLTQYFLHFACSATQKRRKLTNTLFLVRHYGFAHPGDLHEFAIYGGHPSCPMGKRQNIYCELLFRNVLRNSVSLYGTLRNFINMGCCRGRNILLFILVLQMVSILSYKFGIRSACFAI